VVDKRVVQLDRRSGTQTDEDGVWDKFGVSPRSIPDWLALVGDSADGFPGLAGWGRRSASAVLAHYTTIEDIPDRVADWDPDVRSAVRGAAKLAERLAGERANAELFKVLATLRVEPTLLDNVTSLQWKGPTKDFEEICRHFRDPALAERTAAILDR
jgi:5'-3' exonuclease